MNEPKIIIAMKLFCPHCGARHIDETRNGEKWDRRAHTTHRCQKCNGDWDVFVSGAPDEPAQASALPTGPAPSNKPPFGM